MTNEIVKAVVASSDSSANWPLAVMVIGIAFAVAWGFRAMCGK